MILWKKTIIPGPFKQGVNLLFPSVHEGDLKKPDGSVKPISSILCVIKMQIHLLSDCLLFCQVLSSVAQDQYSQLAIIKLCNKYCIHCIFRQWMPLQCLIVKAVLVAELTKNLKFIIICFDSILLSGYVLFNFVNYNDAVAVIINSKIIVNFNE